MSILWHYYEMWADDKMSSEAWEKIKAAYADKGE
jgi:hypothetical protein